MFREIDKRKKMRPIKAQLFTSLPPNRCQKLTKHLRTVRVAIFKI